MSQLPAPDSLSKLRIIKYPDPVLRRRAEPVAEFGDALAALAARMCELMHERKGVGLAGPQVGLSLRLFVWNPTGQPEHNRVCVNPKFTDLTELIEAEEGCLSLPDVNVTVRRARSARIAAQNDQGEAFELEGQDLVARIWQHETDHLDGKLILDYMSQSDEIANRKIIKELEAEYKRAKTRR